MRSKAGEWFTRQESADYLGVSTKTISKYVKQGKLSARYEKGPTGEALFLDKGEVEALKEAQAQVAYKPATQISVIPTPAHLPVETGTTERILEAIAKVLTQSAPPPSKLLLTIDEAAQVSGLPRSNLRAAIVESRLPAVHVSRRWLVKREILEEYVKGL
jgi:excisionase family DNA binding protein